VKSMLKRKMVPFELWGEALVVLVYILNRCPTKKLHYLTPEEMWLGKKPSFEHFRIFGSFCYVHTLDQRRKKLDIKVEPMVLVGYNSIGGYKLYNPITKKVVVIKDVTCVKSKSWRWKTNERSSKSLAYSLLLFNATKEELHLEVDVGINQIMPNKEVLDNKNKM